MNSVRMEPIDSSLAWTAESVGSPSDWTVHLSDEEIDELTCAVQQVGDVPLERVEAKDFPVPTVRSKLDAIAYELEHGRGFALLAGIPVDRYRDGEQIAPLERLFWGLACQIGYPEIQDRAGNKLHHVRAVKSGEELQTTSTTRAYQTNVKMGFHNDGSDALMFCCRRQAKSGGQSRLVSAVTAFNQLVQQSPELAETLQEPFVFDVRGQLGDGRPTQTVPIYLDHHGFLSCLYKRGYIELAQRFEDVPRLTDRQIAAMDALDEALNDPRHTIEFMMEPGMILFANNYAVLHARSKFEDWEDADLKRHFLRIWLTLRKGRPLPPQYKETREYEHSYRRKERLRQSEKSEVRS